MVRGTQSEDACGASGRLPAGLRAGCYWEMAASFITSGVLNQELFLQSGGELLFIWTKIQDVVPEVRKAFNNPKYMSNVEKVANAMIDNMNRASPKAYEEFVARVKN
jgi:hypothetical protein